VVLVSSAILLAFMPKYRYAVGAEAAPPAGAQATAPQHV
jgi:hypothetical protein